MKKEDSTEYSNMGEAKGRDINADDLKFMRSAIEKTSKQADPYTHTMIMWGVICLIGYPAAHFLIKYQLLNWTLPVSLSLVTFGLCYIFVTWRIVTKRDKDAGFVPLLRK